MHLRKFAGIDIDTWIVASNGTKTILPISVHLVIYSIYSSSPSSWGRLASAGAGRVSGDCMPWLIGVPAVGTIALPEFLCGNASNTACTIAGISSLVSDPVWWLEPAFSVPRSDLLPRLFPGGAVAVASSRATDRVLLRELIAFKHYTRLSAQYNKMRSHHTLPQI